jgi:hypothetical protein
MSRAKEKLLPGFSSGEKSYKWFLFWVEKVIVARLTLIGDNPALMGITNNLK